MNRLYFIYHQLRYGVINTPMRFMRIIKHITGPHTEFNSTYAGLGLWKKGMWWIGEFMVFICDFLFVIDFILVLRDIVFNPRKLTDDEILMFTSLVQVPIYHSLLRINPNSIFCKHHRAIAYVAGHSINCWKFMEQDVLVHEFVHVWQYERVGAVYAMRALYAQCTEDNYNYGGIPRLISAIGEGVEFNSFNYEQQAQIVQDFYNLTQDVYTRGLAIVLNPDFRKIQNFLNREGIFLNI